MATCHFCDMCGEPFGKGEYPYLVTITHRAKTRTVQEQQRCAKRELCVDCTDRLNRYIEAYRRGTR